MSEVERLREALEKIRDRLNESGTGEIGLIDTINVTYHIAKRALAAAPPGAERWMPMDSAPHDRKIDLLYPYPRNRAVDCLWDDDLKCWHWREPRWERGVLLPEDKWAFVSYPNAKPLGWMECPAVPPSPAAGEK